MAYCENMTDRGLLEGIGSLHELTSLCLTLGYNLTAQALSMFLHRPCMTSIVLLELSFCHRLNDEGLKGIAERCSKLICVSKLVVCLEHAVQMSVYVCEVCLFLCLYLQVHAFERIESH